ncbi:TniQ family protein [Paraburkholderia phenoliruptrix]|uniref:TniQ family protein n=1 Tax=Paraburkholderia phenoliruptrix TaxID=252970 RepID=UPI002869A98A|nr:TniQ family protein [Paraburkholderia phenoliruptrix]WMY11103.1 TniQ family protein [Paraburkholderia phenoliruptrix]
MNELKRSMLNPVAPIGIGTPDVESMVSYFCRVAMSHCISANDLGREVVRTMRWDYSSRFRWFHVQMSGMSEAAENWVYALSKLTGVSELESLTLLPLRGVVAMSLPRIASARWCPCCIAEDRTTNRKPYFRLAWDVGVVTACPKHEIKLVEACPTCEGSNTRHASAFVMPGWCTSCGAFFGGDSANEHVKATKEEVWVASQIGAMLAGEGTLASAPTLATLRSTIQRLIDCMDDGKSAVFARRLGLGKTILHHWLTGAGAPSLAGLLRIASATGLTLPKLLSGDLPDWQPGNGEMRDLDSVLAKPRKYAARQVRDWDDIRTTLLALADSSPVVSVAEAARSLKVSRRELYCNAKVEARALGKRWIEENRLRGEQSRQIATDAIKAAYTEISASGKSVNLRGLLEHMPAKVFGRLRNPVALLREIREGEI